jgi:transposase-like protein
MPNIKLSPTNIRIATRKLAEARAKAEAAEQHWQMVIRQLLAQGSSVTDVAEAAGVSRQRVYQIRDGKR